MVIDGATNTVTHTITVGALPNGVFASASAVAVDPATDTVYVAIPTGDPNNGIVSVIDGATNAVTDTITVAALPTGVAINPATDTVFVSTDLGKVSVIDGPTKTVTQTITMVAGADPSAHTDIDGTG